MILRGEVLELWTVMDNIKKNWEDGAGLLLWNAFCILNGS